jgi:cell division protein FtsL
MDAKAKEDLLDIILEIDRDEKRANRELFISVMLLLLVVAIILVPKIYLRNNIYYKSRNIAQLNYQHMSLKQENMALKQKLQKLKFKNQTIDTIY